MSTTVGMAIHIALLIAATTAHHISSTPPRIAQDSSNHLLRSQGEKNASDSDSSKGVLHGPKLFNRVGMLGVATSRYAAWTVTILEVIARLLSAFPYSTPTRAILPILLPTAAPDFTILSHPPPPRPQRFLTDALSPMFLLPVLLILIGFVIRRECFAAMGRHFSFTHTTLEGHQLVKGGPYGVVRHPSYTGEVLVRGGMAMLLLAPNGFVRSCGAFQQGPTNLLGNLGTSQLFVFGIVRTAVMFYIAWISFGCTYLIWRAPKEDESLRETFGKQWEDYAKEVPYRFIPYVA